MLRTGRERQGAICSGRRVWRGSAHGRVTGRDGPDETPLPGGTGLRPTGDAGPVGRGRASPPTEEQEQVWCTGVRKTCPQGRSQKWVQRVQECWGHRAREQQQGRIAKSADTPLARDSRNPRIQGGCQTEPLHEDRELLPTWQPTAQWIRPGVGGRGSTRRTGIFQLRRCTLCAKRLTDGTH